MGHAAYALTRQDDTTGFAARVRAEGYGQVLYRVETYDQQGRECWFLMQLPLNQLMRLQQTDADEIVDLQHYGTIIDAGWGH